LVLQGFELGNVGIALTAETGLLESEIVEVFAKREEDLGFDYGGADGVDAGFERRNAEQAPFGIGDGLYEGLLGIGRRLVVEEEALDVLGVYSDVVGWQQDGAAGEPGFRALWDDFALQVSVFGAGRELRVGVVRFSLRLR
jgi:hypothetical protein